MLTRIQYLVLTLLASISLVLMIVNMVLFSQNRAVQAEVASRAQYIQQALQLRPLHQEIVKALADLSVRRGDNALRDLLVSQGITVNSPQNPPQQPAPPAPEPKGAARK